MKRYLFLPFLFFAAVSASSSLDIREDIINPGMRLIGTPYRLGGTNPSGFDCSGFVGYLYGRFYPDLPRISRDMAGQGNSVSRNSLRPGDLVFFATGLVPGRITHVAVFIGQDSILHSISNGPQTGVVVSSLSSRYWNRKFTMAVRLADSNQDESFSDSGSESSRDTAGKTETVLFARGRYTGSLLDGEPEGKGTLAMNNGDRYEGEFKSGLFDGEGIYYWKDGTVYKGLFHKGSFSGRVPAGKENYLDKKDSPWDTWDGVVDGDFKLWMQQDMNDFEEWKKNN